MWSAAWVLPQGFAPKRAARVHPPSRPFRRKQARTYALQQACPSRLVPSGIRHKRAFAKKLAEPTGTSRLVISRYVQSKMGRSMMDKSRSGSRGRNDNSANVRAKALPACICDEATCGRAVRVLCTDNRSLTARLSLPEIVFCLLHQFPLFRFIGPGTCARASRRRSPATNRPSTLRSPRTATRTARAN
jgi:hypothetical protein